MIIIQVLAFLDKKKDCFSSLLLGYIFQWENSWKFVPEPETILKPCQIPTISI